MNFPKHKCGMTISHNEHKTMYQTVEDWILESEYADWESEEEKKAAIDSDEVWCITWHPNTPVGFCSVAASTLEKAIDFANTY